MYIGNTWRLHTKYRFFVTTLWKQKLFILSSLIILTNINHNFFLLIVIIVFTVHHARKPLRWFNFPAITRRIEVFTKKITLFCSIIKKIKFTLIVVCKKSSKCYLPWWHRIAYPRNNVPTNQQKICLPTNIGPQELEWFHSILSIYFRYFVITSPWKTTWSFIWTTRNPHHPRMLYSKFGWNWRVGSGENIYFF